MQRRDSLKDYTRDYATAAFRFYAENGKSSEKYRKKIYDEALENMSKSEGNTGVSKPTEAAIMAAEKAVNDKLAELKDMEAVELTLAELQATTSFSENSIRKSRCERRNIVQAIEIVYFKDPEKELEKGDIHNRVHTAELFIPASESSIYRWLKQARQLFSEKRGLRLKN